MATNVQRWSALGEALLNRPATAAQLTKLGDAIANKNLINSSGYATMTNSEKAGFCLDYILATFKDWMKDAEAAAALKAAEATAVVIDTDFAKTP